MRTSNNFWCKNALLSLIYNWRLLDFGSFMDYDLMYFPFCAFSYWDGVELLLFAYHDHDTINFIRYDQTANVHRYRHVFIVGSTTTFQNRQKKNKNNNIYFMLFCKAKSFISEFYLMWQWVQIMNDGCR